MSSIMACVGPQRSRIGRVGRVHLRHAEEVFSRGAGVLVEPVCQGGLSLSSLLCCSPPFAMTLLLCELFACQSTQFASAGHPCRPVRRCQPVRETCTVAARRKMSVSASPLPQQGWRVFPNGEGDSRLLSRIRFILMNQEPGRMFV